MTTERIRARHVRISDEEWPCVRGIFQLLDLSGRRRLPTEIYADARCLAQSHGCTILAALDATELRLLLDDAAPSASPSLHPDSHPDTAAA